MHYTRSRGVLRLVGGCTWHHNNIGGVILGVSLRARCDTTLVKIIGLGNIKVNESDVKSINGHAHDRKKQQYLRTNYDV